MPASKLDARPPNHGQSRDRDQKLGLNDSDLLDSREGQTASKTRSRWPFCGANRRPHPDDTQRGDRALRSPARSDLSVTATKTPARTGVARGAPSPAKGAHRRIAGLDAASDCRRNAPQHGDCVSREGARYLPGDCRRAWDITATGAANRFQESRLRTPSASADRPVLLPLRASCCTAANGGSGPGAASRAAREDREAFALRPRCCRRRRGSSASKPLGS